MEAVFSVSLPPHSSSKRMSHTFSDDDLSGLVSSTVAGLVPVVVESCLYGIYIVLYSLAIFVLVKRKVPGHKLHLWVMTALFVFLTMRIGAVWSVAFRPRHNNLDGYALSLVYSLQHGFIFLVMLFGQPQSLMLTAEPAVIALAFLLANTTADLFLIYRCYVVWGRRKAIVAFPCFLVLVEFALILFPSPAPATFSTIPVLLASNLVITGLTAGRIWWIGRQVKMVLEATALTRYNRTIAIILESGLLYPLAALWVLIAHVAGNTWSSIPLAFMFQLVGIAPTIVIVRVGLGVSIRDVSTTVATLRAAAPHWREETTEGQDIGTRNSIPISQSVVSRV